MRETEYTARRRGSGYRIRRRTVWIPAHERNFWKLRDLLWRTSQTRDYQRLFSGLDEYVARDAMHLQDLEQQVLDFAAGLEDGDMLRAWVADKQLIRKRVALTELRDRLSWELRRAVQQPSLRLKEIDQRVKHEGSRIVERHQMRINESQHRIKRTVVSQRSKRLKGIERRLKRTAHRIVQERQRQVAESQDRMRRTWANTIPSKIVSRLRKSNPGVWYECELDPLDLKLLAKWDRGRTTVEDRERLEWARRGEKAALLYYRRGLGRQATDVSIQQLDRSTTDWRSHDLRVDGCFLDVKNVRCTDPHRFQEHFWRDHKRSREGDHVGIVGSVSMLGTDGGPAGSLVIGEVTDSQLRQLGAEVNRTAEAGGLSIEIDLGRDWRSRVPGWLFEYPDTHYTGGPEWEDVLPRCRSISEHLGIPVAPWLVGLEAARCGLESESRRLRPTEETIFGFLKRIGLSRRSLFCFVLLYMLAHRHDSEAREALIGHIFFGEERSFPLGLYDPRQYVRHLIQALEQVIRSKVDLVGRATNFRLHGVNILQARLEQEWHTILAYCGNCGRWPIYLGASEPCPCGKRRLLCDDPECLSCGWMDCGGREYDSFEEAREAAKRLPNWRLVGRTLLPPRPFTADRSLL